MRLPFLALCFVVAVLSQVPCNQMSVDQCASACSCQRVACCCGPNCDKLGSTVNYNRCVAVGSDVSTWNCPSIDSCANFGGRAMTITPCAGTAPTPSSSNAAPTSAPVLDFGTTFPMLGTQAVPHQSFQGNVYFGTSLNFNQGAYWGYTDSYSVPSWNTATYDADGNEISSGGASNAPTPAPDYTGTPCFIASPCPSGYYCKLNPGNNIQQRGFCTKLSTDYYAGGAGQWLDSDYYNSLAHPPLILDPNHNGPSNTGGGSSFNFGGYGGGSGYFPNGPGAAYSPPAVGGSCAGPSVCGYKSVTGDCWCDGKCQSSGDCCGDISRYCSYT